MTIFLASFMLVFLRAFQQKNVIGNNYWMVMPTSFLMAVAEVAVILLAVQKGWWSIPWMGAGGALGCVTAMYIHNRWVR